MSPEPTLTAQPLKLSMVPFRAEFDAALRTADDLFSFAKAQGSPGLESIAVQQQIAIYLGLGEFATARDLCRRALVLDDPSHNASYGIFRALRPPAYPRIYFGRTLAYLGYFAPAAAELGTAVVEGTQRRFVFEPWPSRSPSRSSAIGR